MERRPRPIRLLVGQGKKGILHQSRASRSGQSDGPNVSGKAVPALCSKDVECKQHTDKDGAMWSPTSVRTILTNSWYIGQYTYNVHSDGKGYEKRDKSDWITVEHHHEPIVDEDTFYRIKFLLARNRCGGVPAGKTYVRKNIHIFSGLMECGVCGS